MGYLTTDEKRALLHVLTGRYRERGFTFTTALGLAIEDMEPGYDWQSWWPPSSAERAMLKSMESGKAAR